MSEIDEKARKMGWVPQEEWKGAEDKWRPAEEFVERGENIVPILRDRLEKTEKKLEEFEADFNTVVKTQKNEIKRVTQESYDRAKAEFDKKNEKLDEKELEAIKDNDTEGFQKVKKERAKLKEPEKPEETPAPTENKSTPAFEEWHKKNDWYALDLNNPGDADKDLTTFALGYASTIGPGLSEKELFETVEKKVRKLFPDKFTNPNRKEASPVESGGQAPAQGGKKTWADVSPGGKTAFERAAAKVKSVGGELKKEDWMKDYFTEED